MNGGTFLQKMVDDKVCICVKSKLTKPSVEMMLYTHAISRGDVGRGGIGLVLRGKRSQYYTLRGKRSHYSLLGG